MRVYFGANFAHKACKPKSCLWFCNKEVCRCVADVGLPVVFEVYSALGRGVVFLCEGDIFLENAAAVIGREEAYLYFVAEIGECESCDEFVSGVTHTAASYGSCVVLQCGEKSHEVYGGNFESCDCVNIASGDYLFFKFQSRLVCVFWNGDCYRELFNIPATRYFVENGVVKVEFAAKISCGGVLYCEIDLKRQARQGCEIKFDKITLPMRGNYNDSTFPLYFFELLFISRLLENPSRDGLISPHLCCELADEIDGILDFLGEFCGVSPCVDGGVILLYQCGKNKFETRKFLAQTATIESRDKVVENIVEVESFQLGKESFKELSKILLNF